MPIYSKICLFILSAIWLSCLGFSAEGSESVVATPKAPNSIPSTSAVVMATPSIVSQGAASTFATLPSFTLFSEPSQPSTPITFSRPSIRISTTMDSITVRTSENAMSSPPLSSTALMPSVHVTVSPLPSQSRSESFGWEPEHGQEYGNVIVRNNCPDTLYLKSVGVWPFHGYRDSTTGFSTKEDDIKHTIVPGGTYTEPYRITCPIPVNKTEGYCWSQDKLYGQGVSLKVSKNDAMDDILQIEYSLIKNPLKVPDPDTIQRLEYDVSLLDCGSPGKYASMFQAADITDIKATSVDHEVKVEKCPGYEQGIAVTFANDTAGANCEPIKCNGKDKCMGIYMFDRTRQDEPSKRCKEEYRGDMVVDLCAGSVKGGTR